MKKSKALGELAMIHDDIAEIIDEAKAEAKAIEITKIEAAQDRLHTLIVSLAESLNK